jgi:hypothetical protein
VDGRTRGAVGLVALSAALVLVGAACGSSGGARAAQPTTTLPAVFNEQPSLPAPTTPRTTTTAVAEAPTSSTAATMTTSTTAAPQHGHRTQGNGGGRGRSAPAPKPLPGPATDLKWVSSPSTVRLHAGNATNGAVVVKNLAGADGTVPSPGCPSGPTASGGVPQAATVVRVGGKCAPSGKLTVVRAGGTHTWEWQWAATATGRPGAAPLRPGSYTFTIGGATVTVTVVP